MAREGRVAFEISEEVEVKLAEAAVGYGYYAGGSRGRPLQISEVAWMVFMRAVDDGLLDRFI